MAHRQVGFDDERRRPTYGGTSDVYRPRDNRERDRDRDLDRDRRDDRRSEMRPGSISDRRDSSASDRTKDHDPKGRNLPPLNTNIEHAPPRAPAAFSNSAVSCNSPASSLGGPSAKTALMPPPKTQDLELQEVVILLYKLLEYGYSRYNFACEKLQRKKDLEKRKSETEKYLNKTDQFPQQMDLIQKARDRDKAELDKVEAKQKNSDQKLAQYVEAVAANIIKHRPSQPTVASESSAPSVPDPHPLIAELAAQLATFQKDTTQVQSQLRQDLTELQKENANVRKELIETQVAHKMLQTDKKASQERIKQLELDLETDRSRTNEIKKQVKSLESRNQALTSENTILNSDVGDLKKRSKKHGTESSEIKQSVKNIESNLRDLRNPNWAAQQHTFRQDITKLQQDSRLSVEQSANAKKEVESIRTSVGLLENRIHSSLERGDAQKDIGNIRDRVTTLEMAETQHSETLADLQNERDRLKNVENKTSILDKQIADMKTWTDVLDDSARLVKVVDGWTLLDLENVIPDLEEQLESLKQDNNEVRSLISNFERPSSANINQEHYQSEQDTLRKNMEDLKSTVKRLVESHPLVAVRKEIDDLKTALKQLQQDLSATQSAINTIKPSLLTTVNGIIEDQEAALAEMIEETNKELKAIATRVGDIESKGVQARTPAPTPQLDVQVSPAAIDTELADRVKALEDEHMGVILKKMQVALKERFSGVDQRQASYSAESTEMKNAQEKFRGDVARQFEQQELQLQNLNSHFSHINTEGMAKIILGQLNTYATKIYPKLDSLTHRIGRVEQQVKSVESSIKHPPAFYDQQLSNKRPASSQSSIDMGGNKRRLTPNGSLHISGPGSNQ